VQIYQSRGTKYIVIADSHGYIQVFYKQDFKFRTRFFSESPGIIQMEVNQLNLMITK